MTQSNILATVDVELQELERRRSKLEQIRAIALELAGVPPAAKPPAPRPAPASTRAPRRASKARSRPWTVADALEPIRELLTGNALTIHAIFQGCGKGRNTHTESVVRTVLEQLGARELEGKWELPRTAALDLATSVRDLGTEDAPQVDEEVDQAYLERAVLRELQKAPASAAGVAELVDAPEEQAGLAISRLIASGQLSRMDNGLVVG